MLQIQITGSNTFRVLVGKPLAEGGKYELTAIGDKSTQQNRAFHALLTEYYRWGGHSYGEVRFAHFRALVKRELGVIEKYERVVDSEGKRIPHPVLDYRLKSISRYTKAEMTCLIDMLIAEAETCGINTQKWSDIREGMDV